MNSTEPPSPQLNPLAPKVRGVLLALSALWLTVSCRKLDGASVTHRDQPNAFTIHGVIRELKAGSRTVLIKHEEIPDFMPAMTMPFKVKEARELAGLQAGDEISFRLHVADDESWIDQIVRTGQATPAAVTSAPATSTIPTVTGMHPLLDYKFTNEFGRPVAFNDFKGQAIAYTFFFTRCPIPEYCPRLSKNFVEASQKLSAMSEAPTNWNFISVSFDPAFDTPAVLQAYARFYHYDSNHWTFLTGPSDKIAELARASDVTYEPGVALFTHNFRTLVVDAAGRLHMNFPIGGNLSDALVGEILKAAAVTNR